MSNQIFIIQLLRNIQTYKVVSPAVITFKLQLSPYCRLSIIYPKSFVKIMLIYKRAGQCK